MAEFITALDALLGTNFLTSFFLIAVNKTYKGMLKEEYLFLSHTSKVQ